MLRVEYVGGPRITRYRIWDDANDVTPQVYNLIPMPDVLLVEGLLVLDFDFIEADFLTLATFVMAYAHQVTPPRSWNPLALVQQWRDVALVSDEWDDAYLTDLLPDPPAHHLL